MGGSGGPWGSRGGESGVRGRLGGRPVRPPSTRPPAGRPSHLQALLHQAVSDVPARGLAGPDDLHHLRRQQWRERGVSTDPHLG